MSFDQIKFVKKNLKPPGKILNLGAGGLDDVKTKNKRKVK